MDREKNGAVDASFRVFLNPLARRFCIGYGCIFALFPELYFGWRFIAGYTGYNELALLLCAVIALSWIPVSYLQRFPRLRSLIDRPSILLASLVGMALLFPAIMQGLRYSMSLWLFFVCIVLLGVCSSVPRLSAFVSLHMVHREQGRAACVLVLAGIVAISSVLCIAMAAVHAYLPDMHMALPSLLVLLATYCIYRPLEGFYQSSENSLWDAGSAKVPIRNWVATFCTGVMIGAAISVPSLMRGNTVVAGVSCLAATLAVALYVLASKGELASYGRTQYLLAIVLPTSFAFMPFCALHLPSVGVCLAAVLTVVIFIHDFFVTADVVMPGSPAEIFGLLSSQSAFAAGFGLTCLGGTWVICLAGAQIAASLLSFVAVLGALLSQLPVFVGRNGLRSYLMNASLPGDMSREERMRRVISDVSQNVGLTPRETEVFALIASGYSRDEIAEALTVSGSTVRAHTSSIYAKLGVHSQRELINQLSESGLEA